MPIWLLSALPWLKRALPYLAGIGLVLAAYWWADERGRAAQRAKDAAQIAALNQTIADVRAKTAQAQADDAAHKQAVETQQDTITKDSNDALQAQLADARAVAARYAAELRGQSEANHGGGGAAPVPGFPTGAGSADGQGGVSIMAPLADDLTICAENTVKAQGWLDWYEAQAAVKR